LRFETPPAAIIRRVIHPDDISRPIARSEIIIEPRSSASAIASCASIPRGSKRRSAAHHSRASKVRRIGAHESIAAHAHPSEIACTESGNGSAETGIPVNVRNVRVVGDGYVPATAKSTSVPRTIAFERGEWHPSDIAIAEAQTDTETGLTESDETNLSGPPVTARPDYTRIPGPSE
jgi:hypothetical protein